MTTQQQDCYSCQTFWNDILIYILTSELVSIEYTGANLLIVLQLTLKSPKIFSLFLSFATQYKGYNNDTNVIKDRVMALANAVDAVSNVGNTSYFGVENYLLFNRSPVPLVTALWQALAFVPLTSSPLAKSGITYAQVLPEKRNLPVVSRSEWSSKLSVEYVQKCSKLWAKNFRKVSFYFTWLLRVKGAVSRNSAKLGNYKCPLN